MINKLLLALFLSLMSWQLLSGELGSGGSQVGGGGGLSEINLIYAWNNFGTYLNEIKALQTIKLNDQEKTIIDDLLFNYPLEKNHTHLFFLTKDQYKFSEAVYHETLNIGENISFNIDQLFTLNENKQEIPYSFGEAMGLLINVFNRGRTTDQRVLTSLSKKIQNLFVNNISLFNYSKLNRYELQILTFNLQESIEVLAIDSFSMKNLSTIIQQVLVCDNQLIYMSTPKLLQFYNLYIQSTPMTDLKNKIQKMIIAGKISYQCDGPNQLSVEGDFSLTLNYKLINDKKTILDKNWWNNPLVKAELDLNTTKLDLKDLIFKRQ